MEAKKDLVTGTAMDAPKAPGFRVPFSGRTIREDEATDACCPTPEVL